MGPVYATVEELRSTLEVHHTSRVDPLIMSKLDAGARMVEDLTHRRFYPEIKTITYDYPNNSYSPTWIVRSKGDEFISVVSLESGGTPIVSPDFFLYRPDGRQEPPYSEIQLDLSSSAAFGGGDTHQRNIEINALTGYRDDNTPAGMLVSGINSSTTIVDIEPLNGVLDVGIGSVIRVDTERMITTKRRALDTGFNITMDMAQSQGYREVSVSDGTAFGIGEMIIVGVERMLITDIVGNTLAVDRARDGTTLAAHTTGADIYALRRYTVERGALGTTAAAHDADDQVDAFVFPGLVKELNIAETGVMLEQAGVAYARTIGSGDNAREASGAGLDALRHKVYWSLGRTNRKAAI